MWLLLLPPKAYSYYTRNWNRVGLVNQLTVIVISVSITEQIYGVGTRTLHLPALFKILQAFTGWLME